MSQRIDRINAEIQRAVADIINKKINDPRVHGIISVLKVDTSNDLSQSVIALSVYDDNREEVFDVIKSASGFIRKQLASKVLMRNIPKLIFQLDTGIEYSAKINEMLGTIDIPAEIDDESEDN